MWLSPLSSSGTSSSHSPTSPPIKEIPRLLAVTRQIPPLQPLASAVCFCLCRSVYSGHFAWTGSHSQHVALCVGLPALQIMFSRRIHIVACVSTSFCCCGWTAWRCVDRLSLVYPFICEWTLGLFPLWGYYELCCREHSHTSFYVDICFWFFRYIARSSWFLIK